MIRTLIVDDEPLARKRLRTLLAAFSDVQVKAEAGNGADAVTMIETEPADLLLLDVQMPDLDGFSVLRMVETERMPLVIFVTAYDEYAVNAFEVSAVDYLLKPVRRERLAQALSKAREQLAARSQASTQLNRFLHTSAPQTFTELEGLLDPHLFQRIHRQIIVNLNHVREITTFDNNTARLTLTGGQQVSVSRNHLKALRQTLNW
jgi:two-component system LytT family response regulator